MHRGTLGSHHCRRSRYAPNPKLHFYLRRVLAADRAAVGASLTYPITMCWKEDPPMTTRVANFILLF